MKHGERLAMYGICTIALVLGLRGGIDTHASASNAVPLAADTGKIATCDVLALTEALFSTDTYAPGRKNQESLLKSQLLPLETELDALQRELQTSDPNAPETQTKGQTFESKREAYFKLRQELSDKFDVFVSGQFAEAYERVQAAARAVANENGFTYVLGQKHGAIAGPDPQRLMADLLARPMLVSPEGSDISLKVRDQLKLPATATGSQLAPPAKPLQPPTEPGPRPTP